MVPVQRLLHLRGSDRRSEVRGDVQRVSAGTETEHLYGRRRDWRKCMRRWPARVDHRAGIRGMTARQVHDRRLRRSCHDGRRAGLCPACRAHRDVRQRRHALVRAAGAGAALLPDRPGQAARSEGSFAHGTSTVQGLARARSRDAACSRQAGADSSWASRRTPASAWRNSTASRRNGSRQRSTRNSVGCSSECTYRPQVELLEYLRENGFKTYIVSGGGIDLIRAFAEEAYGIPREQVIGSSVKMRLEDAGWPLGVDEGSPNSTASTIARSSRRTSGSTSAAGRFSRSEIRTAISPCCGTRRSGPGARLALLVHHDDAEREFVYDREFKLSPLAEALDKADDYGITVVSMKRDWATVF